MARRVEEKCGCSAEIRDAWYISHFRLCGLLDWLEKQTASCLETEILSTRCYLLLSTSLGWGMVLRSQVLSCCREGKGLAGESSPSWSFQNAFESWKKERGSSKPAGLNGFDEGPSSIYTYSQRSSRGRCRSTGKIRCSAR